MTMPEYIRALVVILALATFVFVFAKAPATAVAIAPEDFVRRRNTWFFITLAGFLSQNYWVFVVIISLLIYNVAKKDSNKIALFFFLVLAVPQIKVEIPGFAGIRYFFSIDYVQILTIILLLPLCIQARKQAILNKTKSFLPDKILGIYILLNLIIQAQYDIPTNVVRSILNWVVDVVVPYYAISRSIKDIKSLNEVMMSFVVAAAVASLDGVFEFFRHWVLYRQAGDALGVDWVSNYLTRGDGLRARATSGHPIVFGYVISIAILFWIHSRNQIKNRFQAIFLALTLAGGSIASISRGPWVGLVVGLSIILLTTTNVFKNLLKLSFLGIITLGGIFIFGYGDKVISFIPFIGNVESENITYRARLFESAIKIIFDNPFFGSTDYLSKMEDMRQGEGIIDLVNTLLIIALNSGLVGLGLFLSFFGWTIFSIYKIIQKYRIKNDYFTAGQIIIASIFTVLVTISTTSPLYHIPILYWSIGGIGLAYVNMDKVKYEIANQA
jgi:O-antigen ligase